MFNLITWACAALALVLLPLCAIYAPEKLGKMSQFLAFVVVYGTLVMTLPRLLVRRYLCR